jgi:hypothetical protein
MSTKSSPPTVDPPPRRGEWWTSLNAFQMLLLFVAGVMILILGIHLEEGIRGHAAWRRYEAEAEQRGVKLTLADYIPPPIPDAENFASIPIFDAAFRAADERKEIPNPFKFGSWFPSDFPKLSDPIKQTRIDFGEWQRRFVQSKMLPVAGGNAVVDVLKMLDHYAEPLAELHTAATRPHCRFPVHWEQGPDPSLPHMSLLMDAARLYALRLSARLELGDSVAAYDDFRDGLRLAAVTIQEPSEVCGFIRMSITTTMVNAVWNGLAAHQWKEPELRKIEVDLAALDWMRDWLFWLGCSRAHFNTMTDMAVAKPQMLFASTSLHGLNPTISQRMAGMLYPVGWTYQSKVRGNHYCDEMSARMDIGQRRWFGERPAPSAMQNVNNTPEVIYYLAFWMLAARLEHVEQRYLYIATVTDHARLACALERFRLIHGNYPATLAELAPEYIPNVPVEIVNGQPYHYRLTDDGSFVLYSPWAWICATMAA